MDGAVRMLCVCLSVCLPACQPARLSVERKLRRGSGAGRPVAGSGRQRSEFLCHVPRRWWPSFRCYNLRGNNGTPVSQSVPLPPSPVPPAWRSEWPADPGTPPFPHPLLPTPCSVLLTLSHHTAQQALS